ncbi:MAG TPA: transcriptional regulator [Gemmatimonadales bacterium]|nr:transcriptional regulator [Gemmatimonadales bacterium]
MAKSNAVPKTSRDARPTGKPESPRLESVAGGGAPMGLDRIIHERIRLAIVSALAVNPTLSFNDLKKLLGTSDGNLSVHARKLEEAGYLTCTKQFEGRIPRTEYSLTASGRKALQRYLDHMEALIQATRAKPRPR